MSYLKINNVFKSYDQKKVLNNISLDIEEGEFLCLLGPSGCGKTTLLRIIAGLEDVNSGTIILQDKDITNLEPSKRGFGIVFQSYALFPNMNVYKNIAFGLENKNISKSNIDKKVKEVLEVVELSGYEKKYPSQLSGGQQQRVSIARSLIYRPAILLADEPTASLDVDRATSVVQMIKAHVQTKNMIGIMITHDKRLFEYADRVIEIQDGKIEL